MSKQVVIALVVVVLLVIAGGVIMMMKNSNPTTPATSVDTTTTPPTAPESVASTAPESSDSAATQGTVKEFTVTGSNFKFEPATLSVNKGDTVKITFKNSGGMHDFVIDEFKAQTKTIQSGSTDTVTFTADKTGKFDYYCSVGNHRAMGMQGVLTVQ